MSTGYERIYSDLLPGLARCNIAKQAKYLGLRVDTDGSVPVLFLGRPYRIKNDGVEVEDGLPVNINNRSLIIHYITSPGRVAPKYSFVPINRLAGMIEGRNEQDGWFVSDYLLRETEGRYAIFEAIAKEYEGTYIGQFSGGDCWQFHPFPQIPIQINFFESDEEFPAEIQFLFDETAPCYMGFESLAFLSSSVLHAFGDSAKKLKMLSGG